MSEFDNDAFDEGLRRVVEGQGVDPPPSVWAGVRLAALERQLITYKSTNQWLKGTVGMLTALLGAAGYLLYQSPTPAHLDTTKQLAQAIRDTVFLTRTETVYQDRPVVVYVEKSEALNKYSNTNFNPKLIDQNYTSNTFQTPQKIEGSKNSLNSDESQAELSTIQGSDTGENQKDEGAKINTQSELAFMNPILTSLGRKLKMPALKYRRLFAPVPDITRIRIPLSERMSLAAYASPDWNRIDVRRDEPGAFKYGDEELQVGLVAGIRAGVKLSEKWTIFTGVEFGGNSFDDGNRRVALTAESINGTIGYQYRSALGTVGIPSRLLTSVPRPSDAIGLEIHEPILRYSLTIPLALRYQLWQKHYLFLGQVPMNLRIYGTFGGYWQLPLLQEGKVQIYESSGREFTADLHHFHNLASSWGIQAGAGTELGIGRHFNVFVEPNVSKGLTSVVKNMSLTTTLSGFGVKAGTRWSFEKR